MDEEDRKQREEFKEKLERLDDGTKARIEIADKYLILQKLKANRMILEEMLALETARYEFLGMLNKIEYMPDTHAFIASRKIILAKVLGEYEDDDKE